MPEKAEAAVLGGGPGGYVAAIRLGQLGKKTILIEKDTLGGVCMNVGCIPSKALIRVAKLKTRLQSAKEIGIEVSDVKIDFQRVQTWKQNVVNRLVSGIEFLCKAYNVKIMKGEGSVKSAGELEVLTPNGAETIETRDAIIATGSRPIEISGFKFDGTRVITSTEALALSQVPGNFVVVGGGVTGLEMGTMYAQLGSKVVVIEMLDQLLPGIDMELVKVVERSLRKLGVEYHVKSKAKEFKNGKVYASLEDGKDAEYPADNVLVSVGRRPNSDGIGLEKTGVKTDSKGNILVDRKMQTNVSGVYAIGDVVGPPLYAHKASKQGIVAAEVIAGMSSEADFRAMPWAVFTDPEIASVGLTQAQAQEKGYETKTARFPFTALGRALLADESDGFVRIVADKNSDLLLGVHIVGAEASNLISEAALAIEMGATGEDLALTVHPHPTLSEAIMEAAEAAEGKAIHIVQR